MVLETFCDVTKKYIANPNSNYLLGKEANNLLSQSTKQIADIFGVGQHELIRPLYMVKEADILSWKRYNDLNFIQCACRFTENCVLGDNGGGSKRQEMKVLIKKFRQISEHIDVNIFNSMHNVNLETIIGYRNGNKRHSFLDEYDNLK